ncbi:MAG: S46 family peptidase, partial [bacterium]
MSKKLFFTCALITLGAFQFSAIAPEEGMFPLSEIQKVDLKKAGLKIDQKEVYNPNGLSLIDALVNVGGCTGSFLSDAGLIITNHHCAFESVQLASTPENDYLTNGFVAKTMEQEIPAKNLTCKITDSYEDVSDKILSSVKDVNDPVERINAINKKITEIIKEELAKDASIKPEISEMFIGRTYVLFRYKIIKDVRLVYIPQRAIGEFGGESDNWVWPRHTGDFSFLRAYVAKDGSAATYSKENVPYKPKKFLKVNPNGANDGDFVFILGYPGRT